MGATIKDVAAKAGVSTATVSRYLQNPEIVSQDKGERVANAIKKLEYIPNNMAKALSTNRTNTIGVIVPDIRNVYYPPIVRGIEDELDKCDYISFLCNTDNNLIREKKYISNLLRQKVSGMIVVGSRSTDIKNSSHLIDLRKLVPVLMVNENILEGFVGSESNDEEEGSYIAVKYLLSLGHKRIAFVCSKTDATTYVNKKRGYERALKEADIALNDKYVYYDQEYEKGGYHAMCNIFANNNNITGIHTANDQMASGVISAILAHGYSVPEHFSVIGYSNSSISEKTYPGITTVEQYGYQLGKNAAKRIVKIINGEDDNFKSHILKTKLIIRNSTGPYHT